MFALPGESGRMKKLSQSTNAGLSHILGEDQIAKVREILETQTPQRSVCDLVRDLVWQWVMNPVQQHALYESRMTEDELQRVQSDGATETDV